MSGDLLALGAVGVLAAAGASLRRSGSTSCSVSSPLDLPVLPSDVTEPGFYYKPPPRPAVQVYGKPSGRDGYMKALVRLHQWRFRHNPDDRFRSPLVNYDNMHFMGGYSWRPHHFVRSEHDPTRKSRALIDQMIAGSKPAAGVNVAGNWIWRHGGDEVAADRAKRQAAERLHAYARQAEELIVGPLKPSRIVGAFPWGYGFTLARPETLQSNFDLDAWATAWTGYGLDPHFLQSLIDEYGSWTLDRLIRVFAEDEHRLPLPIRGLVLGFPISTTASIL